MAAYGAAFCWVHDISQSTVCISISFNEHIRNFRTHVLKLRIFRFFAKKPEKSCKKVLHFFGDGIILSLSGAKWSKSGAKWRR
jgi:hypothetical protein